MTEEELKIVISAQTDGLKTGLDNAMSQLNGFKNNINKSTSAITNSLKVIGGVLGKVFATGTILKFGKDAINIASDLEEVQNVVDVAFGDMSYKAEEFAKNAIKQFGMSELSAKQTSSTFMAMAKSMGLGMESASNMAIEVAKLSGDVASFYNISVQEASTKLKSIFTGETETLKTLGVVMTETNLKEFALSQGITKNYNAMTQAEKVALRYNYVMSALGDAQGDFTRTQGSWANQTRILSEQWKSLLGIIGNGLVSVLTPLIRVLNSALTLMISFAKNISNLFGIKTESTIANVGASVSDVGDAYEEMGDQAEESGKKAKKGLMGFDEITNLQQDSASAKGGIGGGVGDLTTIENQTSNAIENATNELDKLNKYDFSKLKKAIQDLKNAFKGIGEILKPLGKDLKEAFSIMLDGNVQKGIDGIATSISFIATDIEVMKPAFKILNDLIGETLKGASKLSNSVIGKVIETWTKNISLLTDALSFLKPVTDAVGKAYEWLKQKFEELFPDIDLTSKALDVLTNGIVNVIFPISSMISKIADFKNGIVDMYNRVKPLLQDMLDFVSLIFTGQWNDAWSKMKDTTLTIWDGIASVVKKSINGIIDSVNKMIGGLETALNVVANAINRIEITNPFTGKEIWSPHIPNFAFSRIPKLARGGIVDSATTFIAGEHGKEAVIPLENNTEWMDAMARKVVGMMSAVNSLNNDSVTINVPLEINGREIANATIKDLNLESIRRGYKPILNT